MPFRIICPPIENRFAYCLQTKTNIKYFETLHKISYSLKKKIFLFFVPKKTFILDTKRINNFYLLRKIANNIKLENDLK